MSEKKLYDSFHISNLLVGKLYNTLTIAEEEELEVWLSKSVANREVLEKFLSESVRNRETERLREFDAQAALKKVRSQINDGRIIEKSGVLRGDMMRIAAAATVLLVLTVGFWLYKGRPHTERLSDRLKRTEIVPGGNKAMLILSNGTKIDLQAAGNGNIANQAGAIVSKQADGKINYQDAGPGSAQSGIANTFNTLYVPKGGQFELTLPDGTHVWLNAASSLTYPVAFNGKERHVKLTGEAYFEVAKNPGKPFLVDADGKQTVKVLGTHFDVRAYKDDADIRTTLLEGSVIVSCKNTNVIIKPGQMAISNPKEPLIVKNADIDEVMGWKNGLFVFNDESIYSVMKIAARWYDVDVEYGTDMSHKKLRGVISKYKNITELLDNIAITSGIHYKIEGRRVILSM